MSEVIEIALSKESGSLNQEEVERVRSLIDNIDKPLGTCSSAYPGKSPFSVGLNVLNTTCVGFWIMDSGATNHMTYSPNDFSTYLPCLAVGKYSQLIVL